MSVICTIRDYILAPVDGFPGTYYYWDKELKALLARVYASIDDFFELDEGSIIDVANFGSGVYLVLKGNSTTIITYQLLTSTSGDPNNTLLTASVTGSTLTVTMYSTTAKETTTFTFDMQVVDDNSPANAFTPCFNDYEIPDNTILTAWCDGYTYNEIVTDGGVAELNQTFNSVICGYSVPLTPFRFSEEKQVEFRSCVLTNPTMFVWKNALGGWDYWLFEKYNIETLETDTLGTFQKNYDRISDITNPTTERGKTAQPKIVYGANDLTQQQKIGLKGLLTSNKVYILNQDGTINRDVRILPGTYLINNSQGLEIQIEDVPLNTIRN